MKTQTQVTTSRPVPLFDGINEEIFSTKKSRAQTERKYRPPPPPHPARIRSTLSRNRVRSCLPENRAMAVSFKDDSDSSAFLSNSVYNTADQLSFLDQCFTDKKLIGSGCFGEVYSARSRLDGRMYAIKKSRQGFRSNADRRRRLEEVRKHERLPPHRHCVAFRAAWEQQEHLYLQTELCATSLAELAERDHSITEDTVWAYMVDLLLAVKHLHDNQLVHLDIKPENIFVMEEGYCKLGDFGLVMDCSSNRDLNDSDVTEGDPKYLAPELMQARFSPAADVFSLGLTLLELACDLELPRGAHGWHLLRTGRLPDPLRAGLSPDLRDVLERMLAPEPERRATADQLLQLPSVRRARRRRRLQIAARLTLSAVRGAVWRAWISVVSAVLLLAWLLYWPVGQVFPLEEANEAPAEPSQATSAPSPLDLPPPPPPPPDWVDPTFSDLDDTDSLDVTLEELQRSGPAVRNSTPKLESSRSRVGLRRSESLRRELAFGLPNGDVAGEPGTPTWPPAVRGRRLEESFNSVGTGDGSPVTRPRRIGSVQVRLDFRADLSDDDD